MNLHCFFYTPVKTRSLYRSSLECSNGSKSTYSTQLTKISRLQRLIAPKPMGVSPPQMLPKRSSNASALVQSKSQVRRPLRYGATGVQSHPILVTVTACRLWPTSAPKRRPAIDPKRAFTTLFYSNSRNTTAVLSSGSPWMKESPVKTATRHSLFTPTLRNYFWNGKVLTSACSTSSGYGELRRDWKPAKSLRFMVTWCGGTRHAWHAVAKRVGSESVTI